MNLNQAFSIKVFVPLMIVVAWMVACLDQSGTQIPSNPALKPGDQIDGMILTTGAADAPPLWAFCSPTSENQHVTKTECRIPPMLTKVAIGHALNMVSEVSDKLNESEFIWKLSVDGQSIDLARFGTYDFVIPTMPPSPSPIREVFKKFTAWDVVLANLKPGVHTVHGLAQSETDTYGWIANLNIEGPAASGFSARP
jgi:hypothetical protein